MNVTTLDINSNTLPGVNIGEVDSDGNYISGGYQIITDDAGNAYLPDGLAWVKFSFVGMITQIFPGNAIPSQIVLSDDVNALGEVIITGSPTPTNYLPYILITAIVIAIIYFVRRWKLSKK